MVDPMTRVQRHDGKVWLANVRGIHPGTHGSSVHGCQAVLAEVVGEAITYQQLICYTGLAFRLGVHKELCPSAGHPACGYECVWTEAVPWKTVVFKSTPWDKPKDNRAEFEQQARDAVKASIDRGIPVHYSNEEDGLIIGYADEGRRWICLHPYHKGGEEQFYYDEGKGMAGGSWPWFISIWTEAKPPAERPQRDRLAHLALTKAVKMWETEKVNEYFVGKAAYRHWLEQIRALESIPADKETGGAHGSGWYFDTLVQYRRAAAGWLREIAPDYPPGARRHLLRAAELYDELATSCMKDLSCPWSLFQADKATRHWPLELRRRAIARIEQAARLDEQAIEELRQALAALPVASAEPVNSAR